MQTISAASNVTKVSSSKKCEFDITFSANLGPGSYSVQAAIFSDDTHLINIYEWRDLASVFNVVNMISKVYDQNTF